MGENQLSSLYILNDAFSFTLLTFNKNLLHKRKYKNVMSKTKDFSSA